AKERQIEELNRKIAELATESQKQMGRLHDLGERVKKYGQPMANAVVIVTLDLSRQSPDRQNLRTIDWPKGKRFLNVNIPVEEVSAHASYRLVVIVRRGKLTWQSERITKDEAGYINWQVGREYLPDGEYVLTIYGRADGQEERLSQNRVQIQSRP